MVPRAAPEDARPTRPGWYLDFHRRSDATYTATNRGRRCSSRATASAAAATPTRHRPPGALTEGAAEETSLVPHGRNGHDTAADGTTSTRRSACGTRRLTRADGMTVISADRQRLLSAVTATVSSGAREAHLRLPMLTVRHLVALVLSSSAPPSRDLQSQKGKVEAIAAKVVEDGPRPLSWQTPRPRATRRCSTVQGAFQLQTPTYRFRLPSGSGAMARRHAPERRPPGTTSPPTPPSA